MQCCQYPPSSGAEIRPADFSIDEMNAKVKEADALATHCLSRLDQYLAKGYAREITTGQRHSSINGDPPENDLESAVSDELMVYGAVLLSIHARRYYRRRRFIFLTEVDIATWNAFHDSLVRGLKGRSNDVDLSDVFSAYVDESLGGVPYRQKGILPPTSRGRRMSQLGRRLKQTFSRFPADRHADWLPYAISNVLLSATAAIAREEIGKA
jgi:hypothetical protein